MPPRCHWRGAHGFRSPPVLLQHWKRFWTDVVAPDAATVDRQSAFPERGVNALAAAGLLGAISSPEVGGLGLGSGAAAVVGRVAEECGSTAMVSCMHYCGDGRAGGVRLRRGPARPPPARISAHWPSAKPARAATSGRPSAPHARRRRRRSSTRRKAGSHRRHNATAYVWSSQPLRRTAGEHALARPGDAGHPRRRGRSTASGCAATIPRLSSADGVRVPESRDARRRRQGLRNHDGRRAAGVQRPQRRCSIGLMESAVQRTAEHASGAVTRNRLRPSPICRRSETTSRACE